MPYIISLTNTGGMYISLLNLTIFSYIYHPACVRMYFSVYNINRGVMIIGAAIISAIDMAKIVMSKYQKIISAEPILFN